MNEFEINFDKFDENGRLLFKLTALLQFESYNPFENMEEEDETEIQLIDSYTHLADAFLIGYNGIANEKVRNAQSILDNKLQKIIAEIEANNLKRICISNEDKLEIDELLRNWGDEIYNCSLLQSIFLPDFILDGLKKGINIDFLEGLNYKKVLDDEVVILAYIEKRLNENQLLILENSEINDDRWLFSVINMSKVNTFPSIAFKDLVGKTEQVEIRNFILDNPSLQYQLIDFEDDAVVNNIVSILNNKNQIIGLMKLENL